MKYSGKVGYAVCSEDSNRPGIWIDTIVEKPYKGDVLRSNARWQAQQNTINDNLTIDSQISIVADPYAYSHAESIKYATLLNAKWKVTSIEVKRPRINLTLGGVYNGEEPTVTPSGTS